MEGLAAPHPGVCNGPVVGAPFGGDSEAGALLLAPVPALGVQGLPAELTMETALPCADEGPGSIVNLAFTTGTSRAEILHANNNPAQAIVYAEVGENFSCQNWAQENGPGRLVLSNPAIDVTAARPAPADLITVFVLDD